MNFVDSLKIFGVEARQKPSITGNGAPTTETEGAVGEFYMDTDTGDVYKCTAVADGAHIWKNTNIDFVDKCCPSFAESGSVVTCDPVEGYPLNVVSHIEPVQSGSGDPSPENVRPITGWGQVKVRRVGKNLINPSEYILNQSSTTLNGDVFTTTTSTGGPYLNRYDGAKHHPAGTYTVSILPLAPETYMGIAVYDKATSKQIASLTNDKVANGVYHLTFTATDDFRVTVVGISGHYGTFSYRLQMEAGTTATEYEPYRGEEITLDLGQTVYGGSLDWKTGLLTITCKGVAMKDLTWSRNEAGFFITPQIADGLYSTVKGVPIYCSTYTQTEDANSILDNTAENQIIFGSTALGVAARAAVCDTRFTTEEEFTAYLESSYLESSGSFLVYPLKTPTTVQLTPQEILSLSGTNTLYSDTGDTDISGKADPTSVIEKLTNAIIALGGNV